MSDGIHVVSVEVQDFHRLTFAQVDVVPEQGLVRVTGKNAAGKTSLLRAIAAALGGQGEINPDAIHEGADGAEIRVRLDNGFTVTRKFTANQPKGYLTVVGPDGGKHKQGKLSTWLGDRTFDPLSFLTLKPDQMRTALLSLAEDQSLPDKLDEARAEQRRLYDERTPWISQQRKAKAVEKPAGERPEPVDVSAEMERMESLQRQQDEIESLRRDLQQREEAITSYALQITAWEEQIASHKAQIVGWRALVADLEATLGEMPDCLDEIDAVRTQIANASVINERLEPWKAYDRARTELKEAQETVDGFTQAIEASRENEKMLLQDSGIPIPNLSFDSETGEPLLNGHPLSGASGRERIDLAVAAAIAANPDLRICLLDEANDLDLESLEALGELANKHDFQVWVARIGLEGAGEIVVEDGVAKAVA